MIGDDDKAQAKEVMKFKENFNPPPQDEHEFLSFILSEDFELPYRRYLHPDTAEATIERCTANSEHGSIFFNSKIASKLSCSQMLGVI